MIEEKSSLWCGPLQALDHVDMLEDGLPIKKFGRVLFILAIEEIVVRLETAELQGLGRGLDNCGGRARREAVNLWAALPGGTCG
jgi:hypothetical protein